MACNIHKGQLHSANEDVDIATLLLDNGGTKSILRMTKTAKETAFHYVCSNGNYEVLSAILEKIDKGQAQIGVNLQSAIGLEFLSPIMYYFVGDWYSKLFISRWSPLCAASAHGNIKCVESILEVPISYLKHLLLI